MCVYNKAFEINKEHYIFSVVKAVKYKKYI